MENKLTFKLLAFNDIREMSLLGQQLNPKLALEQIQQYFKEMFEFSSFYCFGLFQENNLIGISSGWVTVRLYCGKQLELDNVVIDNALQSKGLGTTFFQYIEEWAKNNGCQTIELNTYVQNAKSHKFYFNTGYKILGFHFQKHI